MRYPASETAEKHARILQAASRLFRERGFSAVSVSEIMKSTGLTHGPFYNHFSSKEALMQESVEQGLQELLDQLEMLPGTYEGLTLLVEHYLSEAHRDSPGTGCTIAALASQIRQEPQLRSPFTEKLKAYIDKLAHHFPWRSKNYARGYSIRMLALMAGALILARAVDDPHLSKEIMDEARQGLL